jgi:superfamily II DNA/RNA helicase
MTAQPIGHARPVRRKPRRTTPAGPTRQITSAAPAIAQGPRASFAALGVPAALVEALGGVGVTAPFPIQEAVLPDALAGSDILGRGRTGSGKTLAFSIPLVARLAGGHTSASRPRGLVLVPTRELASQVHDVLRPLAKAVGLRVGTVFGGTSQRPQVAALRSRVDIIVACPGRLADLLDQGQCHLGDVEICVVDEADHMADLGFLPIVRRLLDETPADGQRMFFSATLDNAVDVLVRRFAQHPAEISVDPPATAAAHVHHVLTISGADRTAVVAALAAGNNRSLIFTRTKHGAQRLARQLAAAQIPATELHGNLAQRARERNLASFSSGAVRVMVATDIAARGIHVDNVDLVIHADVPAEHKTYLHRSGRTARAGADGVVVTLQTEAQARDVRALMSKAGVIPLAATVTPRSAVLATIAGPPARRVALARPPAVDADGGDAVGRPTSGGGAVAMSANYRGRRPRSSKPGRRPPIRNHQ